MNDLLSRPTTQIRQAAGPWRLAAFCPGRNLAATAGPTGPGMMDGLQVASGRTLEVVAGEADENRVRRRYGDWTIEAAWLHLPPAGWAPPPPRHRTRLFDGPPAGGFGVPPDLERELRWPAHRPAVAISLDAGRPAGFCWVTARSDRWWDASIETLPRFRRRGHARSAFGALAAAMASEGRQPIWGATVGNLASSRLAARVGLVRRDRLLVCCRGGPDQAPASSSRMPVNRR